MQNTNIIGAQDAIEMQANRVNYLFLYLILNGKLKVEEDPDKARIVTYVRAHLFNVTEDNMCSFDLQLLGPAAYPGGERLCNTIVSIKFPILTFLMASLNNEIDNLISNNS